MDFSTWSNDLDVRVAEIVPHRLARSFVLVVSGALGLVALCFAAFLAFVGLISLGWAVLFLAVSLGVVGLALMRLAVAASRWSAQPACPLTLGEPTGSVDLS
jgi:hypothetical protein